MNNKGVGSVFCLIAAILMAAKYLSAAVYMGGGSSWNQELFRHGLDYVGKPLSVTAVIALAAGIVFLVWGIVQDVNAAKKK